MAKASAIITLRAKLCRPAEGGQWTFLRLPKAASDRLPTRNMVSVDAAMNGFAFQATLQPDSEGGHWLKVEPGWSQGAKAAAGDTVELELSPVAVEPEPELPDDLRDALAATPEAMSTWTKTTPLARRDWIAWLGSGKRPETRAIHMAKMMDMLSKGKRRVCCFDRSGMASKGFRCPVEAGDE